MYAVKLKRPACHSSRLPEKVLLFTWPQLLVSYKVSRCVRGIALTSPGPLRVLLRCLLFGLTSDGKCFLRRTSFFLANGSLLLADGYTML
eukprot:1274545-Amphidinium_carterae.1